MGLGLTLAASGVAAVALVSPRSVAPPAVAPSEMSVARALGPGPLVALHSGGATEILQAAALVPWGVRLGTEPGMAAGIALPGSVTVRLDAGAEVRIAED